MYTCILRQNNSTNIEKGLDVDDDKTSETSETPKQIINGLHTTAVKWKMDAQREAVTHILACLRTLQESGVGIAAHPAR